ncbi:hypothetical protein LCGC14_2989140 [marine sediment metagenome]|uniref:Uncharacterized protein n=1 Tax=marine sediment metagenome TaxID=412755 RepID=A0A0F8X547_9ZZZZ
MGAITISCEKDDDFTQVSAFENALYTEVNKYRKDQGFEKDLILQFIMVKEAQDHANGLANGSITDPAGDINERWHTVESKLGVNNISNKANFSYQTDTQDAAAIVAAWPRRRPASVAASGGCSSTTPAASDNGASCRLPVGCGRLLSRLFRRWTWARRRPGASGARRRPRPSSRALARRDG